MKEIEIRLKCSDEGLLRERLNELEAKPKETYEIVDVYYAKKGEGMNTAEKLLRVKNKGYGRGRDSPCN